MIRLPVIAILCALILFWGAVHAQTGTQRLSCGPQMNGSYILCEPSPFPGVISQTQDDFLSFIKQLYTLALLLAGTVAFIQIVRGGVMYGFSGIVDKKNDAKRIFKGVAQGLGLLMGSYLILRTINPALVSLSLPSAQDYFPSVSADPRFGMEPQQNRGLAMTPEMTATWQQAQREFKDDIPLIQDRISALEAKGKNLNPTEAERLAELKIRLSKTQGALGQIEYQLSTKDRLKELETKPTTDDLMKMIRSGNTNR